jgi:hypothetical protein
MKVEFFKRLEIEALLGLVSSGVEVKLDASHWIISGSIPSYAASLIRG